MHVVLSLEKTSEKLHLHFLCEAISSDAAVASLFSLALAHTLGGALVLADKTTIGLVAKDIFLGCAGVASTGGYEERLCLRCGGEEDELLGGLGGAERLPGDAGGGLGLVSANVRRDARLRRPSERRAGSRQRRQGRRARRGRCWS